MSINELVRNAGKRDRTGTQDAGAKYAILARRRRRLSRIILGVLGPVLALLIWQLLGAFSVIDTRFIPEPVEVGRQIASGISDGTLTRAIGHNGSISLERWAPGFVIGSICGLTVGVFMGLSDWFRFMVGPIVYGTFPVPKVTIYPLLIVVFGIGSTSIIVNVAIGSFYMLCVNTVTGVMYINPIYRDVAAAFKLRKRSEYLTIIIPAALPAIISGVRLALGTSLIVLIATEFVGAESGIGYYIWNSWQVLNIPGMFAGLVVVAIFGILTNWALNLCEKLFVPWSTL